LDGGLPGSVQNGKRSIREYGQQPRLAATKSIDLMNSLFAIAPYKFDGFWVFDDPSVGLRQEPFVSGADDIIDILTKDIPDAASGFKLVFSPQRFPGFTARFDWRRPEHGGNWYGWAERGIEGWLCPALFKYFETAPKEIFVKVAPR
jgi:hypothetical protein